LPNRENRFEIIRSPNDMMVSVQRIPCEFGVPSPSY
jgi:hypothetical protein